MSWSYQPILPASQLLAQTSPTVALSSPADSATGVSTTPDLVFTGTDTDSDDVRYEVQVHTDNLFGGVEDNFNRSNSSTLGSNWSLGPESIDHSNVGPQILSNRAYNEGSSDCDAYYSGETFTNDQFAQATIKSINSGTDDYPGVLVRASATDYVMLQGSKFAGQFSIYWYNGGAYTSLGTYSATPQVNDVLRIECVGTTFYGYINGTLRITGSNAGVPASGAPGILVSGSNADESSLDDFSCGNVSGAPLINAVSGTDAGFSGTINGNGVSITNIVASDNATPGTSFTTSSISPVANRLYLLTVNVRNDSSTQPVAPTVTGAGLTWVSLGVASDYDTTTTSMRSMFMFRARGSSPSSGALTVDFGATSHTGIIYNIDEFTGIDGSGTNGSGAVVQVVSNADSSSSVSSITGTLSAFGSSQNATYAVFCNGTNALTATAGTGFAKVGEYQATDSNTAGRMVSEFKSTNDTTADLTYSSTCQLGVIAVEIKAGDPFQSGTSTTYAVQSALSNSTVYYWRVRAIDPSGSNNYGAWATTRSFTTTAGGGGTTYPGYYGGAGWY